MSEKYTPRHLKQEEKPAKKLPVWLIVVLAVAVVAVVALVLSLSGNDAPADPTVPPAETPAASDVPEETAGHDEPAVTEAPEVTEAAQPSYQTIETSVCPLQISAQYADSIRHEETSESGVTEEAFYMLLPEGEQELYRIYFGDTTKGDLVGYWKDGNEYITVTVAVAAYDPGSFADEATQTAYMGLMEELNTLLSSIRNDSRFMAEQDEVIVPAKTQEAKLSYWEFALPENVTWEESTVGDVYQADFYGTVDGEKIRLYTIFLGDTAVDSVLGVYTVDGVQKPLGVTTYTLTSQMSWAGDQQTQEYGIMMDTINDVLGVIMAEEAFSAKTAE